MNKEERIYAILELVEELNSLLREHSANNPEIPIVVYSDMLTVPNLKEIKELKNTRPILVVDIQNYER